MRSASPHDRCFKSILAIRSAASRGVSSRNRPSPRVALRTRAYGNRPAAATPRVSCDNSARPSAVASPDSPRIGTSLAARRAPARHRRGPHRVPADLLDRPPDRRRLAARLHRRTREGVRDRDPVGRDARRRAGSTARASRTRSPGSSRTRPRDASCVNLAIAFVPAAVLGLAVRQGDQGGAVRTGPGRDRVHRRRVRHPLGRAPAAAATRRRCASPTSTTMRWTDALKVGIAQAFALIPGTSRSGATIIGGMLFGLSRKAATEFSFFLAVPTLVAAGAYSLVEGIARCCRPPTCRRSPSASPRRSSPRSCASAG